MAQAIGRCDVLVSNDYELAMITNSTGLGVGELLESVDTIITTKGEQGSEIITRTGSITVPRCPLPT